MGERFQPEWFTIPEFTQTKPRCVYHKENEGGGSDGCTSGVSADEQSNFHVLARAEYLWENDRSEEQGETAGMPDTRVLLRITADDYYKLYINGRYAAQGPAPAYPEHYYYNELDITPYLQRGKNVLAVHLYYQGLVNRVWNSGDGRFGIACDVREIKRGEGGRTTVLCWRYQISCAYSGEITGYDTQFLEDFDSRRWEEGWRECVFDDHMWKPMVKADWADYQCFAQPTEMLSVYRRRPREMKKLQDGWFIDVGEEITGTLLIWAESISDGRRIVIRSGEELEEREDAEQAVRYEMRCNCQYEETWTLKRGTCCLEPYDYKGFRYARLICDPGVTVIRVEAEIRHYPMDETLCTLSSDNPVLDGIFRICKQGVKYGTQEGYLDCPTREKGQYLGDAVVSARAHVWLTGDVRMLRKCISQFAGTGQICPGLLAVAPGSYMQEIADFSLLWSQLLLLDYQFTGDKEFLRKYVPVARGIITHFRKYEQPDGLLDQVADKWNLVDWPEDMRDGYDFELSRPVVAPGCHNVINALYVGAVKTLEKIESILSEASERGDKTFWPAGENQSRGTGRGHRWEQLRTAYIKAFYSNRTGLFVDSTKSGHSALHSNIYPLFFGLCPEGSENRIADFLLEKGLCCGVMTGYFYLKALAAAGRYEDIYRILVNDTEHGWANMLREGATACWEVWGKDQKWNTSLCHPWASGPIPVIIEDIAGFAPDPREASGFRFEPHIAQEAGAFCLKFPFGGDQYRIKRARDASKIELCTVEKSIKNVEQEETEKYESV